MIVAVILVGMLMAIEFGLYRPQSTRLKAREEEVAGLQQQITGIARRNAMDVELLRHAGTDREGSAFRDAYAGESSLVYLNRVINKIRLRRLNFRTEEGGLDGSFAVERFFLILTGSYTSVSEFVREIESGRRLAGMEEFLLEPVEGSSDVLLRCRVVVYAIPSQGSASP